MKLEYTLGPYGDVEGVEGVTVTLSRRNLLTLLAKLDGHPPNSGMTISSGELTVIAEEDETHYANRPPAGPMHPDTEDAIRG